MPLYRGHERLLLLQDAVFHYAEELGWNLEAWAILANHYHLIGHSPEGEDAARELTKRVHGLAARELNKLDGTQRRHIWYRCRPTVITYKKSYMTRLAYVHRNPVHHGLVADPTDYPYCSASWLMNRAGRATYDTLATFKIDKVDVDDDYEIRRSDIYPAG